MRHREPRVDAGEIGEIDHHLQRNASRSPRGMIGCWSFRPVRQLGTVGVHPVHVADGRVSAEACKEVRVEAQGLVVLLEAEEVRPARIGFVDDRGRIIGVDTARHDHANVADVIVRVCGDQIEREAPRLRHHHDVAPRRRRHERRPRRIGDLTFAVIEHDVFASGTYRQRPPKHRRVGYLIRLERSHPTLLVEVQLTAIAPLHLSLVTRRRARDPRPGHLEHVDRCPFGVVGHHFEIGGHRPPASQQHPRRVIGALPLRGGDVGCFGRGRRRGLD